MKNHHPQREIQELDIVRVRKGIHGKDLNQGDCGLVVMIYGDPPKDADVEFTTPDGQKNLLMLPLKWLEIVEDESE